MNSQDDEEVPAAEGGAAALRPLPGCRGSSVAAGGEAVTSATNMFCFSQCIKEHFLSSRESVILLSSVYKGGKAGIFMCGLVVMHYKS